MSTTTEQTFEDEPNQELINALRKKGASESLIRLIRTDPKNTTAERNSARMEVNKWVRWNDGEITQDALKPSYGGGFFTKMWDGDVEAAYRHADSNNKILLEATFDLTGRTY